MSSNKNNRQLHSPGSLQDLTKGSWSQEALGIMKIPLHLRESKFGAFGKEYDGSNGNGKRNDDFYMMGDEELQIVGDGCCSTNDRDNNDTKDDDGDGRIHENEHRTEERFSAITIPKRQNGIINTSTNSDGFDVCLEYGYRYEFTEEDDSDEMEDHPPRAAPASLLEKLRKLPLAVNEDASTDHTGNDNNSSRNNNKKENEVSYQTHILGKVYHPVNDYHAIRDDETNLFWMTYRCDFMEIKPYAITSDAGWGCMLRSAQMLLAQVLRIHWKGRDWRTERSLKMRRENGFLRDLLTWFADYPSPGNCPSGWQSSFSLHNMVAAGTARYDILPGEWFGPGTACHVLRDLVNLHTRGLKLLHDTSNIEHAGENGEEDLTRYKRSKELKVYVAPEGTIYQSDLRELLVKQNRNKDKSKASPQSDILGSKNKSVNVKKKNKNSLVFHPLYESPLSSVESKDASKEEWDASLLILIPLRLGLKEFNASYRLPLAHMMSFPQSVGFVGGSPRHALWFYGANSDGSKVFGLDPHTVQRAPRRRIVDTIGPDKKHKYEIIFTDEYLRSINCPNTSKMNMTRLDPSLALGFYCRDREDYDRFCESLKLMKEDEKLKKCPQLFTMAEAKPNYSADVSNAMLDMMMNNSSQMLEVDAFEDSNNADDDDEYILL